MGISWSGNRRRRNNLIQNPSQPPALPPPIYYYSAETHPLTPPRPPPPPPPPPPPASQGYYFPATIPYTPHCAPLLPTPPAPQAHSYYYSNPSEYANYVNSLVARHHNYHYNPYYVSQNQHAGWGSTRPAPAPESTTPPPYVDHQTAKKIRNYVNVHKDTLNIDVDEKNPDHHLVSFVFDAVYDGSMTVLFFAKEEENCRFVPLYSDAFKPVSIPFQKGVGQKFAQPSGTGIDLGFFDLDDLSQSSPEEDVFPLVIVAETCLTTPSEDKTPGDSMQEASPHMQITQCVLEKSNKDGPFKIKVVRQILWIDSVRYELRELYGIASSSATDFDDSDPGKECVICMTEPKDTAVLPCRHMCMCGDCAKALRLQSNKCPICRQPIEELIEIKVNNGEDK